MSDPFGLPIIESPHLPDDTVLIVNRAGLRKFLDFRAEIPIPAPSPSLTRAWLDAAMLKLTPWYSYDRWGNPRPDPTYWNGPSPLWYGRQMIGDRGR